MTSIKNVNSLSEARRILGADFFDAVADILPLVGPGMDMYHGDQEVLVFIELPGLVSKEDVKLLIDSQFLVIEGEIKRPYIQNEEKLLINE